MNFRNLINILEIEGYKIGNFKESKFYRMNEDKQVKIGIYARISKRDDIAIERQVDSIKKVIEDEWKFNPKNIKVYIDNGISGTCEKRSAYKKMKEDIECDVINTVITTHIDRFGRLTEMILNDIYCNGNIKYLYIGIDNMFINSIDNKSILLEEAKSAEEYAKKSSIKAKSGLKRRMKSGSLISSKPPYGYKLATKEGLRVLELGNIEDVEVVKSIFNMYVAGKSIGEISKVLNLDNITPPSGEGVWTKGTIKTILNNPLYSGVLYQGRYKKQGYSNTGESREIIKVENEDWINGGEFEGIIDSDMFKFVQDRLNENNSTRTSSSDKKLFTSILKCGDCGRSLVYRKKSNGYNCSGAVNAPYNCKSHLVKEEELKELVSRKIKEYIKTNFTDKTYESIKNRVSDYNRDKMSEMKLEKINEDININLNKIREIYISNISSKYKEEVIRKIEKEIDELKLRKMDLENRIKNMTESEYKMIEILNNILEINIDSNSIYALFIKEVRVYENNKIEIDWRY